MHFHATLFSVPLENGAEVSEISFPCSFLIRVLSRVALRYQHTLSLLTYFLSILHLMPSSSDAFYAHHPS